jgi:large subunit ribosomal protein L10
VTLNEINGIVASVCLCAIRRFFCNGFRTRRWTGLPSEKILEKKKKAVEALAEQFRTAKSVILADYRGLTVEQDTELRRALRKESVDYKVIKNTLAKFAVKQCGFDDLEKYLEGPTSMAAHTEDPVIPAKVLVEYSKKFNNLQVKAGIVEGRVLDANGINELAALPSREQLVASVLAGFNAPIASFVNVLNGNIRGLVVALKAIAEKKAS